MNAEPMILHEQPKRPWRLLAVSLTLTVIGVLMIADGAGGGWFAAVFFGLCTLVAVAQFFPINNSTLTLTPEGFSQRTYGREFFEPWDRIARFVVVDVPGGSRVGLNYLAKGESKATAAARGVAHGLVGVEAMLSGTFGMSASDLAELLNERLKPDPV